MQIIIASDVVPTELNIDFFNNADICTLLGTELINIWNSADKRIFNLEVPLIDIYSPIDKWGPNLIAPISTIKGIKKLNPSLLTVANNHILDQGVEGLKSTKEVLREYDITFIGVGDNISEACKPYIIENDGMKIGIYACAEHEFSIASENTPGANPFDPLESLDHINDLKGKCDYVIVLYHGGKEHYRYPSPYLQRVCRKMVEKGADLIACQHSHCVGCYEKYKESTIVYGQGNFIFSKHDNEFWNTGLLVKVNIKDRFNVEYIPILRTEKGTSLATGQAAEEILLGFEHRSKEILKEDFVEQKYREFAAKSIEMYLRNFAGYGKWISRIDRKLLNGLLLKRKYNKKKLLSIQNYIECEAHRELLLTGLGERGSNKE